jgi:hypothetical protein
MTTPNTPPEGLKPWAAIDDALTTAAQLGAVWSEDFDAYADGLTAIPRCVLCRTAPCNCPPFGTDAYWALLSHIHGFTPPATSEETR